MVDVRTVGLMAKNLNEASQGISDTIGIVGDVATSVINAEKLSSASGIDAFARFVRRIAIGRGVKPTPIEQYVSMVTGQDATGGASEEA